MRRWSLLAILALAVWAQNEELVSKRVYLNTPASFVNLTSESWKLTGFEEKGDNLGLLEDTEEVLVAVRFTSRTVVGRVLSAKFIRQDGSLEAELIISLENAQLQVDLVDSERSSILIKPLINIYMNESAEHSLAVKVNAGSRSLIYSVEQRSEYTAEITKDIQWAGAEILATIGGGPRSVVGCVSLVTIQDTQPSDRGPLAHVIVISQNEVDKCETETECAQRNCGKGTCRPLEVATCDCFGTGKAGPNCANEPKTAELNNNDDSDSQQAAVVYTPWKEDQKINRIAMEFKFKGTYEGVIMYGSLEGGGDLKMYAVGNLGTLVVSDAKPMNFTLGSNSNFHYVGILVSDDKLDLSVDGVTQSISLTSPLLFTSIIFGSSPPKDGVAELGLTACLRNLYIDHLDLLELQANKDNRVSTPKPLKPCSNISIVKGFSVFPTDLEFNVDDFSVGNNEDDQQDDEPARDPQQEKINLSGVFGGGRPKSTMPCEKAQEYLCRNGATCLRDSTRPTCICASGYGGSFCQFSLFPRSCAEAVQFHRLPEGPTRLDVDSSGDLSMSVADCKEGTTKIPHDMPPNTVIRSSEDPKHGLFLLSYMDFTPSKLEKLIGHSGSCRQQVNYKCNHAPLHFSDKRTWFRVASQNNTMMQLGAVPNGCQCIDVGCANQGRCNCDAGIIGTDEGVLQGKQAGVTSVVALHREGDVNGEMTISPLECTGFVSENNAIRFQKPGTYLLDEWNEGALSLQFRTADTSATLFVINQGEKRILQGELLDGHTVKVITSEGDMVIESQAKLNDTKWHLLVIEFVSDELRVSVDAASSFRNLKSSPFGNVTLGDLDRGVLGCFRAILLGSKTVELKGSIDGITFGRCDDSCATKSCHNGAECRENFATGLAQCSCKYPRLHSGTDCSHDINSDSSVSFHGGFLKFEELASALTASWLLSFRTDQSSALLLYAHDENNNFLQLHIRDEVNVTLSLNNGGVVYSCTVQAPPGTEYSDMRWIQVYIDHSSSGSILTVEDEACSIRAGRLLATEPQKSFSRWSSDLVYPPVGIEDVHKKFTYTFIGGVQRAAPQESEDLRLQAIYNSKIDDLLGCVRGVKVGDKLLDLRAKTKEAEDKSLVQIGCDVKCESLSCFNGGHCSVAWRDFNPESTKTTCDCSRTSYAGPHCLQDDGITFVPPQSINFDVGAVLERYVNPSSPTQILKFAFSAESIGYRQTLAILYFNDSSEFEILLNKNGSIHVGVAYADGRSTAISFKGNFTDGYRHFFVARFANNTPTRVYVDGIRQDISHRGQDSMTLFRARRLWIGRQRAPPRFETSAPPKKDLQGCVSNMNLDYGVNSLDLWPLSYLDSTNSYSNLTLLQPSGQATRGSCAAFRNPNQPVSLPNTVSLPVWETNFKRHVYKLQPEDEPEKDGGGISWLLIILGIILLLVLIVLICVVICLCRKGHKKDSQPQNMSLDEREPLRQTQFPQTPPIGSRQPHSNYAVPPPDIQLPTSPRAEDDEKKPRLSLLSQPGSLATTAYYTAQEDFSDIEDLDRTMTPGSEAPTIFEDEISRPTGFDRSSPQRLSSFRDSSAPVGSPLYAPDNNRRPKPVNIPKPPPRTSPV